MTSNLVLMKTSNHAPEPGLGGAEYLVAQGVENIGKVRSTWDRTYGVHWEASLLVDEDGSGFTEEQPIRNGRGAKAVYTTRKEAVRAIERRHVLANPHEYGQQAQEPAAAPVDHAALAEEQGAAIAAASASIEAHKAAQRTVATHVVVDVVDGHVYYRDAKNVLFDLAAAEAFCEARNDLLKPELRGRYAVYDLTPRLPYIG